MYLLAIACHYMHYMPLHARQDANDVFTGKTWNLKTESNLKCPSVLCHDHGVNTCFCVMQGKPHWQYSDVKFKCLSQGQGPMLRSWAAKSPAATMVIQCCSQQPMTTNCCWMLWSEWQRLGDGLQHVNTLTLIGWEQKSLVSICNSDPPRYSWIIGIMTL